MKYYLRSAKLFLDLNWQEKIYKNSDLKHQDIASLLEMGYKPSLRMCKRNFGVTFERFFIHCRVAETKQFLADPANRDFSMGEVVERLTVTNSGQPNFNRQFRIVMGITLQEFRYFHEHFVKTTGVPLVEYEQPELEHYVPQDETPTFLSNFLNEQRQKVIENQKYG